MGGILGFRKDIIEQIQENSSSLAFNDVMRDFPYRDFDYQKPKRSGFKKKPLFKQPQE